MRVIISVMKSSQDQETRITSEVFIYMSVYFINIISPIFIGIVQIMIAFFY